MYGAILGDIVGSPYEFDCNNYKAKDFPLFSRRSDFTDDTVMTLAVAKALLSSRGQDDTAIKAALVREMQQLGRAYPDRGYGTHFGGWLYEDDPQPYQSYGNGSAMRVSPAAWLATDMAETLRLARLTAQVTHDHPEGIKGAQATAAAIFLARTGHDKAEIKAYVEREFGYDLSRTCDEIRPTYHHVESCQETVPQAIIAFLESTDFEDALRTSVSLGGDSDTLAAITGSIAEAFYGVPEELRHECRKRLTPELAELTEDDTRDVVDYILKDRLRVECAKGDTVEFHLLCRDSFGLSYDFTACTYEIDQDGTMAEEVWPDTDYNVRVFWEK